MDSHTFQVRTPHLAAALVPLVTGVAMLTTLAYATSGWIQTVVPIVGILLSVAGIICIIFIGLRTRPLVVDETDISVRGAKLHAGDILSIHVSKSLVNVVTVRWRNRTAFTFQKHDAEAGVSVLRSFAYRNDINFTDQATIDRRPWYKPS